MTEWSGTSVPRRSLRPTVQPENLRSVERNLLRVPRHRLNTYGGTAALGFLPLLVRPPGTVFRTLWNSTEAAFRRLLKTLIIRTLLAHLAQ